MISKILALALSLLLLGLSVSCSAPVPSLLPETSQPVPSSTEVPVAQTDRPAPSAQQDPIEIPPFADRRFIWTNGLKTQYCQATEQLAEISIERYYSQLDGFKNQAIESLLNEKIQDNLDRLVQELWASLQTNLAGQSARLNSGTASAAIQYNCNNVLFIEYFAYLEATVGSNLVTEQKLMAVGYDLNTGNELALNDLFKAQSPYEKLINDAISLSIIEKNYDDPDAGRLSKPFQGIRAQQAFSFDLNGLRIILTEQNEEFIDPGYTETLLIPLKIIGDDLAIFDRYFDDQANLFENAPTKALLPNPVNYKIQELIQESDEYYSINIETGIFENVVDEALRSALTGLAATRLDMAGFKARAKKFHQEYPGQYFGNLAHTVNLTLNAGGFLSVYSYDVAYEKGLAQDQSRFFNYDMDRKQPLQLKDLFVAGFDYRSAIGRILDNPEAYPLPERLVLDEKTLNEISEDDFYLDQYGISVFLPQPDRTKSECLFWVPFESLGWENLVIFN